MHRPKYCNLKAFNFMANQVSVLDTTQGLLDGTIAVSMHAIEDVVPARVHSDLGKLALRVRRRLRSHQPQARLAHLHDVLFEEEGFRGNSENYYSPLNSYLTVVLETRRGIPITLSLIYKAIAEKLDLPVEGLGIPGHFLARVHSGSDSLIVDPFDGGRLVSGSEVLLRCCQAKSGCAPSATTTLSATSHRRWLSRIVRNLHHVFSTDDRRIDCMAMAELHGLLYPGEA